MISLAFIFCQMRGYIRWLLSCIIVLRVASLDHCSPLTDRESLEVVGLISIVSNKRVFVGRMDVRFFEFPKVSHVAIFSLFFVTFLPFKRPQFSPLFWEMRVLKEVKFFAWHVLHGSVNT